MRNFTPEELATYKAKLQNWKSPWLTKVVFGSWYSFGKPIIFIIFVLLLASMIVYRFLVPAWQLLLSPIFKWTGLSLIFGIGGLFLIAHLLLEWKIKATAKQLGLSIEEWDYLIELFNIRIDGKTQD
jgi:hypothetical protein